MRNGSLLDDFRKCFLKRFFGIFHQLNPLGQFYKSGGLFFVVWLWFFLPAHL
jgi:hypothetical protein